MLLITGSKGQLGLELSRLLPQALGVDIDVLDITNAGEVAAFVKQKNIDTIVNCAAYTAVDKAEDDEVLCRKINVDGVKNLAQTGVRLIHISTDYVFDGKNCKPYTETDMPNPLSVYGKTKREGEQVALMAKTAVVIRTSWLYSAYGNNFVKTMRRLGSEKESLKVVADQIGSPTFAGDLAQVIVDILPQINENTHGVYHFSNEGVCSWYDFAHEIMALSNLKCNVMPIASEDYPTKVTRPFYSVLNKAKIKQHFRIKIPHWREGLEKCLKQF